MSEANLKLDKITFIVAISHRRNNYNLCSWWQCANLLARFCWDMLRIIRVVMFNIANINQTNQQTDSFVKSKSC